MTDQSGEIGTKAIIGLDEFLTEGISGKIIVPEVLQQNNFLGQGGAVRGGGDKAVLLFGGFIRGFLLPGLRQFLVIAGEVSLYWRYFGNPGEIFI